MAQFSIMTGSAQGRERFTHFDTLITMSKGNIKLSPLDK